MQFPDMIKRYRANKGITQKELAQQLGTPAITVARIEQGTPVRLDVKPLNLLGEMMEDESLNMLNGIQGIREWFRCIKRLTEVEGMTSMQAQVKAEQILQQRFEEKNIPEKLLHDFENIGFKKIGGLYRSSDIRDKKRAEQGHKTKPDFDLVLKNERTEKLWVVDFKWIFGAPFGALNDEQMSSMIYSALGRSLCYHQLIQKYTLITNVLDIVEYAERSTVLPGNTRYDVSVIYYDTAKLQMSTEKSLAFFKDGQGIFDINVEGKSEAAILDYAKWTLMFDKQL